MWVAWSCPIFPVPLCIPTPFMTLSPLQICFDLQSLWLWLGHTPCLECTCCICLVVLCSLCDDGSHYNSQMTWTLDGYQYTGSRWLYTELLREPRDWLLFLNPWKPDPSWWTTDDATITVPVTFIHNSGHCPSDGRPTNSEHVLEFERTFHIHKNHDHHYSGYFHLKKTSHR